MSGLGPGLLRRFKERLRAELTSRLARDSLLVFNFSVLGRALGLGKDVLVAALFGVGGQLDAYLLALLIPTFLVNLLGAPFSSALVPALGRVLAREGEARAHAALASSLVALLSLLALAGLLLAVLPAQALRVLTPLAGAERLEEIKVLQLALIPMAVLASASNVLAALVNLRGDFKGPALASSANALTVILLTVGLYFYAEAGIYSLVLGLDAGFLLESCLLLALLRRAWGRGLLGWRGQGETVRGLLRGYAALALSAGVMGLSAFVDNALASMVGEGAVSALGYAGKMPSVVATLCGATLSTVLLPHFSASVHRQPPQELWEGFKRLLRGLLMVLGPLALLCALASRPMVELAFQRGGFDAAATELVSGIQVFYLLQLPFYLAGVAASRVLLAKSMHRAQLGLVAAGLLLNAGLSWVLSGLFGAQGIAMSSLCMYVFTALCSVALVRRSCQA